MRPATLADSVERIVAGEPSGKALAEFLDTFYLSPTPQQQLDTIMDEPRLTGDPHLDALAGAIAEYLARQYQLPQIPPWAFGTERSLDHAWHMSPFNDAAMREYLTFASPAEFKWRNIFTEERPLRRARSHVPFARARAAKAVGSEPA
jgi:hypothetical protein